LHLSAKASQVGEKSCFEKDWGGAIGIADALVSLSLYAIERKNENISSRFLGIGFVCSLTGLI